MELKLREARIPLRSESSEEEALAPVLYCTVCGSASCYRIPSQCRLHHRLAHCEALVNGFLGPSLQTRDSWRVYVGNNSSSL